MSIKIIIFELDLLKKTDIIQEKVRKKILLLFATKLIENI